MNIVLIGPPGSGKTTYSKFLEQRLHIPHISVSKLLRSRSNIAIEAILDKTVSDVVLDEISNEKCTRGFILDGYPRTVYQANSFINTFSKTCHVFSFIGERSLLINRIIDRVVCPSCGKVYVGFDTPPIIEGLCDTCSTNLIKRDDDRIDVINERIDREESSLAEVVKILKAKFQVHDVPINNKLSITSSWLLRVILDLENPPSHQ